MGKRHTMQVEQPYFDLLRSGKKVVEGRKACPRWLRIKPGDTLLLQNGADSCQMLVQAVTHYPPGDDPLTDYLEGESLARTLPGVECILEGKSIYCQWWTREQIQAAGMLAFTLTPY